MFGVCRGPFLVVEVAVAVCQGAVDDSPDSRRSTDVQLALGLGFGSGPAKNAVVARGHNDIPRSATHLCRCLVGFVLFCLVGVSVNGYVAWLPEQSRGNSVRTRLAFALGRRRRRSGG